jgi:ferrochelatase
VVTTYDAFLLLSFGGPEKPDDVMPFLENVTRGRGVPKERLAAVATHYDALGGKSPINDHCRALVAALEQAFAREGIALPIYWGNRNWHPMLGDTVATMRADGITRALAFTTSSFSSYSSCRQYLEDVETAVGADASLAAPSAARAGAVRSLAIDKVRQYWNHPKFIEAVIDRARTTLASIPPERRATTRLVTTAHSIPSAMAATCRYAAQLEAASKLVAEALAMPSFTLAYQSRSGPPAVPWLEPDILDALDGLEAEGVTDVLLVPIGFTSDHVEVVWDLDHEARARATELGLGFHRAPTVGTHPAFVAMIVELVRERMSEATARPVVGGFPPEADRCAPACCAYTPRRPPTS